MLVSDRILQNVSSQCDLTDQKEQVKNTSYAKY